MIKRLKSWFTTFFFYAHPTTLVVLLFVFSVILFCAAYTQNWVATVIATIAMFSLRLFYARRKYKTLSVTKSSLLDDRKKCIEQAPVKNKEHKCPRQLFLKEIEEVLKDIKMGEVYVTATHEKVIKRMKNSAEYIDGKIEINVYDNLYMMENLTSTEEKLYDKMCCDVCAEPKCKIYQSKKVKKKKEKVKLYAVKIKRIKE